MALQLAGCYSMRVVNEPGAATYSATEMENVKIFWTLTSAPQHEVLGRITFKGERGMFRHDDTLYAFLRNKAAKMGANGIILESGDEPGAVTRAMSTVLPGVAYREKTVIAIRYKDSQ